jgi:hypothetical protein
MNIYDSVRRAAIGAGCPICRLSESAAAVIQPDNSPVPRPGIEESQPLAPDLFSPRARDARGRFAKGASGNPRGRPPGIRNPRRPAIERLLGRLDPGALVSLVERKPFLFRPLALRLLPPLAPPPRPDLPPLRTPEDVRGMLSETLAAISRGEVSPAEARHIARLARRRLRQIRKARRLELRLRRPLPPHKCCPDDVRALN